MRNRANLDKGSRVPAQQVIDVPENRPDIEPHHVPVDLGSDAVATDVDLTSEPGFDEAIRLLGGQQIGVGLDDQLEPGLQDILDLPEYAGVDEKLPHVAEDDVPPHVVLSLDPREFIDNPSEKPFLHVSHGQLFVQRRVRTGPATGVAEGVHIQKKT
ncbi:MAG: hypothetical protein CO109_01065 [Deltaproteobacteria bacterium CG_4_9_14_3_um_filter_65_9]|nr:MAG: hypothetical protein CO109_01065 [Deltaproteobacteria bacterium CG_4_9_14_3_um_filter_65_9]